MKITVISTFIAVIAAVTSTATAVASCTCGTGSQKVSYNSTQISTGIRTAQNGTHGNYPHAFRNRPENITFPACGSAALTEYPLTTPGPYLGGPPGTDRVIYKSVGGTFCGCVTHKGATGGLFKACAWTY